ncbi:CUE domain-containing protein [Phanerochaete sordida]|uniref:CUE domain-containing protein n=1 Tax=Phanerochaete sordida TaxID=48140 RepID=A0A9P3L7V6_9APHY|nr:CUE domain-containing protein [Phanerochaete sordida]
MSFENAPVTKALMVSLAVTSIVTGIFDVKYFFHLQLVPHISKHHQYWRLLVHHLACSSSIDLLLTELLLYNAAIHIERAFGSLKYASFLAIALVLNTIATFIALIVTALVPTVGPAVNRLPSGPIALVFSIIYQYYRLVPQAFEFKIFGATFSDKIWAYATAAQLAVSSGPPTLLLASCGIVTGYIYRSDILQLKGWRVPQKVVRFAERWIKPLLGEERAGRRLNRVFPDSRTRTSRIQDLLARDEVPTTARRASTAGTPPAPAAAAGAADTRTEPPPRSPAANTRGVVRQWVSELAGAARPNASGPGTVRVPSEAEIETLTAMFPDVARDVVLGVLQRSASIEAAAETLLSSARS